MQPYTGFAAVYDLFMDNVPYEEWADYVQKLLNRFGIDNGLLLELGCGTGSMTRRLAAKGYDMIGLDNSEEMLQIARDKGAEGGETILYLCQDMREFELYGTVAAVISVCDSMNYILSEEDLLQVFKLVNNYLDPQGLFIFDLDTEYAYREVLGDNTIAENREEGSFIWENTYYGDEMVNEINLTLFIPEQAGVMNQNTAKESGVTNRNTAKESGITHQNSTEESGIMNQNTAEESSITNQNTAEKSSIKNQNTPEESGDYLDTAGYAPSGIYRKYEETHYRKAYSLDTVKRLIEEAGMEWVAVYDALTEKKPKKDSERVYIIAREKRQADKLYI